MSIHHPCGQEILIAFSDTGTRMLEPQPDPTGTVEIRRSGGAWRARPIGRSTPVTFGHVKYASHECPAVAS